MEPRRIEPGPGQESVWDYPRPPAIDPVTDHVVVRFAGAVVADSRRTIRILETSQPPAFYVPAVDVDAGLLVPSLHRTFCEWKGTASYWSVRVGDSTAPDAAWGYPDPVPAYEAIAGHHAFYAQYLECSVNGEVVTANEGTFYGGWITSKVVGPFKGGPGSAWW